MLMLLILSDLALLGVSRMRTCINDRPRCRACCSAYLPLLAHTQDITLRIVLIAAASFVLKGFVFPLPAEPQHPGSQCRH